MKYVIESMETKVPGSDPYYDTSLYETEDWEDAVPASDTLAELEADLRRYLADTATPEYAQAVLTWFTSYPLGEHPEFQIDNGDFYFDTYRVRPTHGTV